MRPARFGVTDFVDFVRTSAPATRILRIRVSSLDRSSNSAAEYMKYILGPLKRLRRLKQVDISLPDSINDVKNKKVVQEIHAWTNTLCAVMETDLEYDLEMTQNWSYLIEAARRSVFFPTLESA